MTVHDILTVALTVLAALGGGGLIVLGLSGFLGKLWADRLMASDRARYEKELEQLRADLAASNSKALDEFRAELDLSKSKRLGAYADKVVMYRMVGEIVSEIMADLGTFNAGRSTMTPAQVSERIHRFDRERMRAYAYLSMFAPQAVMDKYNNIIDHLVGVIEGSIPFDFPRIRDLAIAMINETRVDLGIDPSPIQYRGAR